MTGPRQFGLIAAQLYDVTPSAVFSKYGTREASHARQMAWWAALRRGYSTREVAFVFGVTHSTVIRGAQAFAERRRLDPVAHRAAFEILKG